MARLTPPTALFSTLGRIAARAIETQLMAHRPEGWVEELSLNMQQGKVTIFNPKHWDPVTWPDSAAGFGYHEAPHSKWPGRQPDSFRSCGS